MEEIEKCLINLVEKFLKEESIFNIYRCIMHFEGMKRGLNIS